MHVCGRNKEGACGGLKVLITRVIAEKARLWPALEQTLTVSLQHKSHYNPQIRVCPIRTLGTGAEGMSSVFWVQHFS